MTKFYILKIILLFRIVLLQIVFFYDILLFKEVNFMKSIKSYSRKKYSLTINTWYLNPISVARAYNLPDDQFFPFDIDKFN